VLLYDGESEFQDYTRASLTDLGDLILKHSSNRPLVILVDGRSAGGKTTVARKLAATLNAALLSTDDFAWWHSFFDWPEMLINEGLEPLKAGQPLDFTPPAWTEHGRDGSITAAPADVIVIEGVGAGQQDMRAAADVVVWVQADAELARERGLARDLLERPDPEENLRFWNEWMTAENAFQAIQQTWAVADFVILGTPDYTILGENEVLITIPSR
jgi:uridine kinase